MKPIRGRWKMARLIIFEGARCTGKTDLTRKLRQTGINYATLVNFTGFKENGSEGLHKIGKYYRAWLRMFQDLKGEDITFIADRIFFSEMVYSILYKDYDFTGYHNYLCYEIMDHLDQIDIFFLTANEKALQERVKRDKVDFAGVGDDISEILVQQEAYERVFKSFKKQFVPSSNLNFHDIDTSNLSQEDLYTLTLIKLTEERI
jgi:deoxyguanosine kinase